MRCMSQLSHTAKPKLRIQKRKEANAVNISKLARRLQPLRRLVVAMVPVM